MRKGKKTRSSAVTTTDPSTAIFVVAFILLTWGTVSQSSADHSPPSCTGSGFGVLVRTIPTTGDPVIHGDEVCFQVEILNGCGGCCDVTVDVDLHLPDGSRLPVLIDTTVPSGDRYFCPGDFRCATPPNCTLPWEKGGLVPGYRYIVSHVDEDGKTGTSCPPMPAPGAGELSGFIRAAGTVHWKVHVGFTNCRSYAIGPALHACCEPCSGVCEDVASAEDCPFPATFNADRNCDELTCSPLDCSGAVDQCNDATCNPATGACELVPLPDGTGCDDECLCTLNEYCLAGTCFPGVIIDPCCCQSGPCFDDNPCTNDWSCRNGVCDYPPEHDRMACDDGETCTARDECQDGVCLAQQRFADWCKLRPCLGGPENEVSPDCRSLDSDGDDRVDLNDMSRFLLKVGS